MDPLTAFSLACGVIQVLDFSTKVLSQCREIYKNGSLSENESTESMVEHLTTLRADLQPSTTATGAQTAGDKELMQLADRCSGMAKELVAELGELKVGRGDSRWKAGRVVFRGLRKRGPVERLQRDLDGCRRVLDTKVLADLRQRSIQNSLLQTEGFRELDKQIQMLGNRLTYSRETFDKLKEVLRKHNDNTSAHFDSRFQQYEETLASSNYKKALLESLWYPDIQAREEGIKDAHAKTFEWLLADSETAFQPWDNFVAWLEGGQDTYWISGKAGSGKSTLMRYICDDDRTKAILKAWAGSREVLIVKFFFWRAGSLVQKTIIGLLRSLLHQILSALPKLIGTVSAGNVSSAFQNAGLPAWTEARLNNCLRAVLSELAMSHRVCLFLDGLDELDQSYEQILSLVADLMDHSNVKICLSSRPYRIFSDAFSSSAMLRLHDLTKADIRTYVTKSLIPKGLMPMAERFGATLCISDIIVGRADGVFLWAELAVQDVNRGIANEDSHEQLIHRLDSLPNEIEQLYGYMLGCIDNVYKTEAARCFSTLMNSTFDDRGSLLELSLVIGEGHKDDNSLSFANLSAAQTLDFCNSTMRRLPTTCAGLVEVREERAYSGDMNLPDLARRVLPSQFAVSDIDLDNIPQEFSELLRIRLYVRVRFVHRTALDFLQENGAGKKFMQNYNKYAVHECVSRLNSMVGVWRLLGYYDLTAYNIKYAASVVRGLRHEGDLSCDNSTMDKLLCQALLTESIMGMPQSVLWNYVEKAMEITKSSYLLNLKVGPPTTIPQGEQVTREDRWAKQTVDLASVVVPSMPEDFLGYAAFCGLSFYVETRLDSDPRLQCKATYLLACFVSNVIWVLDKGYNLRSNDTNPAVRLVRYLLDRGADPNATTASSTIWGDFLKHLYNAYLSGLCEYSRSEEWALMTMAFLDKGANTAQVWNWRSGIISIAMPETCFKETSRRLLAKTDGFRGVGDFEVREPPHFVECQFGCSRSFSIYTILLKCLKDYDDWAYIGSKIKVSHKEHFSKLNRIHFADARPEPWYPHVGYPRSERRGPFVGYSLSDQQSERFLQLYERCAENLDPLPERELLDHVLALRHELEGAASDAGTGFGQIEKGATFRNVSSWGESLFTV